MAYKSAGGFAGEMKTGGVAEVGKVELIGLDIAKFYQRRADFRSDYKKFGYYRFPVRNDGEGNRNPG